MNHLNVLDRMGSYSLRLPTNLVEALMARAQARNDAAARAGDPMRVTWADCVRVALTQSLQHDPAASITPRGRAAAPKPTTTAANLAAINAEGKKRWQARMKRKAAKQPSTSMQASTARVWL